MIHRYSAQLQVRIHDVDSWGNIPAQILAEYMEGVAWEASADAGFGDDWYQAHHAAWVIHRLTVVRLGPAAYGDTLTLRTWISTLGRVRSSRDYEVYAPDGTPVATGRADWVFVDRVTGKPRGIERAIVDAFETGAPTPMLVAPPAATPLPAPGRLFTATHRVYRYETDSMGHVNNTIYVRWLDEALDEAVAAAGLPLADPGKPGLRFEGTHYVVNYLRSALAGDTLEISSRVTGIAGDQLELTQEIRCAGDEGVMIRAVSYQRPLGLDEAGLSVEQVQTALLAAG